MIEIDKDMQVLLVDDDKDLLAALTQAYDLSDMAVKPYRNAPGWAERHCGHRCSHARDGWLGVLPEGKRHRPRHTCDRHDGTC